METITARPVHSTDDKSVEIKYNRPEIKKKDPINKPNNQCSLLIVVGIGFFINENVI